MKVFAVYKTKTTHNPGWGYQQISFTWERVSAVATRKEAAALCGLLMQDPQTTATTIYPEEAPDE